MNGGLSNFVVTPVTPEQFNMKVTQSADMILKVLGNLIVPVVAIGFLLSVLTLIAGGLLHSDKIKKTGIAGIGATMFGFFLYLISPYIMGLLYSISQIFKK